MQTPFQSTTTDPATADALWLLESAAYQITAETYAPLTHEDWDRLCFAQGQLIDAERYVKDHPWN